MDRVLASVDLLNLIIEVSDTSTQAICARVCKTWSGIAIRNVWYSLKDMRPLFRFFPSIGNRIDVSSEGVLIDDDSWIKFSKYAGYVKRLTITADYDNALHHIYQEIAFSRSEKHILPNLKELTAHCGRYTLLHLALFMHDGLRHLQIGNIMNFSQARRCLHYMVRHAPNITSLVLGGVPALDPRLFDNELRTAFGRLTSLQSVQMCHFSLTPTIVYALGTLPKLKSLLIRSSHTNDEVVRPAFAPDFNHEVMPFALLENVIMDTNMANVSQLLAMDIHFDNARALQILTVVDITGISLGSCFTRLACGWRYLQVLDLSIFPYFGKEELFEDLNFIKLIPLLDLRDLRVLSILHPSCLSITDENVEQMALHWPKMRYLKLNPAPFVRNSHNHNLTLAAFTSFATHCTDLESLAMFIDATDTIYRLLPCARRNLPF